jgi:phosphatidylserine/phosphatidylglycerophosphate/cardiolipin synthase-like enzyme
VRYRPSRLTFRFDPDDTEVQIAFSPDTLPNQGKLHHTLLVLDDQVAISGSFNYTGPANQYNDENLFIVRNPAVAQHFRVEVERVFGQLATDFA